MANFGDWLLRRLQEMGWTQAELARRANITDATLSRIISGTRKAGPDAAVAIARALGEPPEVIFRRAGLLPPLSVGERGPAYEIEESRLREFLELAEQLAALPPGPREQAMEAIRLIAEGARRRAMEGERG